MLPEDDFDGHWTRSTASSLVRQYSDRFIPGRRSPTDARNSLHLSKRLFELNDNEKILYRQNVGRDPFTPPVRNVPLVTEQHRQLRTQRHSVPAGLPTLPSTIGFNRLHQGTGQRIISQGTIWNVGGSSAASDHPTGVLDGRGGRLASGTNAPLYSSQFLSGTDATADLDAHERRLALALDVDRDSKILSPPSSPPLSSSSPSSSASPVGSPQAYRPDYVQPIWRDSQWTKEDVGNCPNRVRKTQRQVPIIPFRVLDAPSLRDDYYCSLLSYSPTVKCLAVGLGSQVYLWSESEGVNSPPGLNSNANHHAHITSLSFSSTQGGQAILAIGRANGRVTLWSPLDDEPRFDSDQPHPVSCVAFNNIPVKGPSARDPALLVNHEELLVGDEVGHVYLYKIEWPSERDRNLFGYPGAMNLIARLAVHDQQICGLAWSASGHLFATGGNDNTCCLFEIRKILASHQAPHSQKTDGSTDSTPSSPLSTYHHPTSSSLPTTPPFGLTPTRRTLIPGHGAVLALRPGLQTHTFRLQAAIKALAFAPWSSSLLAAGGGSNDRCIHFFETRSGATLARIDCAAQVTGLLWATTRREICASFGFASCPEHSVRLAVFRWPGCEQVVAVPWWDECRALCVVGYPGGPGTGMTAGSGGKKGKGKGKGRDEKGKGKGKGKGKEGDIWGKGTRSEGCVVVATSDASIKFHEVWCEPKGSKEIGGRSRQGLLGGSKILESLHGVDESDTVIR
ncbi:WD40 repeat-like protein [Viridothelium virens]|uniref:WD40 repeat-like protein n=1 Tax=Viridothelium virens TaxID=1048519 RepID=A0A6A6HEI9_VIRVR|nr:WD40 repeat-like protein [Viridothelium virens]